MSRVKMIVDTLCEKLTHDEVSIKLTCVSMSLEDNKKSYIKSVIDSGLYLTITSKIPGVKPDKNHIMVIVGYTDTTSDNLILKIKDSWGYDSALHAAPRFGPSAVSSNGITTTTLIDVIRSHWTVLTDISLVSIHSKGGYKYKSKSKNNKSKNSKSKNNKGKSKRRNKRSKRIK
jgi:hypothetical protein